MCTVTGNGVKILSFGDLVVAIERALANEVPATGLGLFRLFCGLVMLQEIAFLLYFSPLIFDPVPYIDRASPVVSLLLALWAIASFHLMVGCYTRIAALCNYLFWVFFAVLTPMWQDFDGGFDHLMIGSSLLLILLPSERAFSIDQLRWKLKYSSAGQRYEPERNVSVLSYYLPIGLSLGLLYFDSAVHKLFAEFWRNGVGAWLPPSMPYYTSPLASDWLLNQEGLQKLIGYGVLGFEFLFIFLFWCRHLRVPLLLLGAAFHAGIVLSLNVYPYGFAMLIHYLLMVPFGCWRGLRARLQRSGPGLTIYYERECRRCYRTVIALGHFDVFRALAFQSREARPSASRGLPGQEQLGQLHARDRDGRSYAGLDVYLQALRAMGYTAFLARLMTLPGLYATGARLYRRTVARRARMDGEDSHMPLPPDAGPAGEVLGRFYRRDPTRSRREARRIAKLLLLVLLLQLNSTIHYGLLHRLGWAPAGWALAGGLSDALVLMSTAFLGIVPHWLYVHDHFDGYNHIFAFSYRDADGRERWLPFVNEQGRLVAPNWGRVQSMWANVAVRGNIDERRFYKFTAKVTAFWGTKLGLDLDDAEITVKMKEIAVPTRWEPDLRQRNMSGPWRDIGRVVWKKRLARIEIPEVDLGSL